LPSFRVFSIFYCNLIHIAQQNYVFIGKALILVA